MLYNGDGHDLIYGVEGVNTIRGSDGADSIWGGLGDDTLYGSHGKDPLTGGAGADVFVFASAAQIGIAAGRDILADFTSGTDLIDLRGLGTSFNAAGLSGGGLRSFYYYASGGLLIGDQNGDGIADWVLELTGAPLVAANDFLL